MPRGSKSSRFRDGGTYEHVPEQQVAFETHTAANAKHVADVLDDVVLRELVLVVVVIV
jgi:hypothetical protein